MDIDTHDGLETKAGIPHDAVVTHGEMMRAFEAFKDANDERLDKKDADVVLEEKLARISDSIDAQARRLDEITLKSARPAIGAERARGVATLEHKQAFEAYVRAGETGELARAGAEGALRRLQPGRRLSGAARDRDHDRGAAHRHLADPLHRRRAHHLRQRLQEAVHDGRPRGRLGGRDRRARADDLADARRIVVPGHGALRHAGGDRDAARGLGGQHRPVDRAGGRAGVRRPGGHGVRHRRRQQQAEGLPRPTPRSTTTPGPGAISATSRAGWPAPFRPRIRPTCWSI